MYIERERDVYIIYIYIYIYREVSNKDSTATAPSDGSLQQDLTRCLRSVSIISIFEFSI